MRCLISRRRLTNVSRSGCTGKDSRTHGTREGYIATCFCAVQLRIALKLIVEASVRTAIQRIECYRPDAAVDNSKYSASSFMQHLRQECY